MFWLLVLQISAPRGKLLRVWIDVITGSSVIKRIHLKHRASPQILAVVVLKFSSIPKHASLRRRQYLAQMLLLIYIPY
jgi:hypothetical protein